MAQATHSPSVIHDGEKLFLVEGTLSKLQVARTTVNLLAQIEKNNQTKNLVSGVAGAVSGMHSMVANAAALALYDGEDVYNFAAVLDEHIVCGTLEHADQFKNGEPVKAVVSQRSDVLYVHAIMQAQTRHFYMPLSIFAGKGAFFKSCMRVANGLAIACSVAFVVMGYFTGFYDVNYEHTDKISPFLLMLILIAGIFSFSFIFELWTYHSFKHGGVYATAIFKVLGFPEPNDIDLTKVGSMNHENTGWKQAWQADLMFQKIKAK